MSKIKIFLMLSGYQLTWLMCVFGELWYNSFIPGLVCGLLFLAICFVKSDNIKINLCFDFHCKQKPIPKNMAKIKA